MPAQRRSCRSRPTRATIAEQRKSGAGFQRGGSRFRCLFYQRKIVCFFFFFFFLITFGSVALTSLLPTDMFAEILGSNEEGKKKKISSCQSPQMDGT